jgi:hypothetical protein
VKFGTGIFFCLQTSYRKRDFCENIFTDSHTSLDGVTQFLAVFSLHTSSPICVEFGVENIHLMALSNSEFHRKAMQ